MDSRPVPLHCERTGQGRPLIILHGLFGSLANWKPIGQTLKQHYKLYLVDARNHGRSPHSETFTYDAMAEDLRAFAITHQLFSANLMGHSIGGKTAMRFALSYPKLVEKLIVVDMTPLATPPRHQPTVNALLALDLDAATNRRELDAQLATQLPDKAMRQFLLTNIATEDDGRLTWRIDLNAIAANYDETNRAIESDQTYNKPALFIRGGDSDYLETTDEAAIKQLFPQAEIVTIEGASHWVHADKPDEFARVVLEFLGR